MGEILIQQDRSISKEEERQVRICLEKRGDVLIRDLCESQTGTIIDVKFYDTDADTYKLEPRDNLLDCWEKGKK